MQYMWMILYMKLVGNWFNTFGIRYEMLCNGTLSTKNLCFKRGPLISMMI